MGHRLPDLSTLSSHPPTATGVNSESESESEAEVIKRHQLLSRYKRIAEEQCRDRSSPYGPVFTATEGVSKMNADGDWVLFPYPDNVESAMQRVEAGTADDLLVRGMEALEALDAAARSEKADSSEGD